MNRDEAAKDVWWWHCQKLRVGMASGAFDLLHAGHLSFLSGFCVQANLNRLVVAVTSDSTVKAKGANRPIIPESQRLAMVSALRCVDAAFLFSEIGDDRNMEIIRPDVFARGDGHTENMTEAETIKRLGIRLVLIHTPRVTSTTEIIARARA